MKRPGCSARQHSDQMCCGRCGLAWDMNDPDPPACTPPEVSTGKKKKPYSAVRILEQALARRKK